MNSPYERQCDPTIARLKVVRAAFAAFLIPEIGNDGLATCADDGTRWLMLFKLMWVMIQRHRACFKDLDHEDVIFYKDGEDGKKWSRGWHANVKPCELPTASELLSDDVYVHVNAHTVFQFWVHLMSIFHVVVAIIDWDGANTFPPQAYWTSSHQPGCWLITGFPPVVPVLSAGTGDIVRMIRICESLVV